MSHDPYIYWVNSLCACHRGRCDAFTSPTKNTSHELHLKTCVTNFIPTSPNKTISHQVYFDTWVMTHIHIGWTLCVLVIEGDVMHSRHQLKQQGTMSISTYESRTPSEVTNNTQWVNHSLWVCSVERCEAFMSRTKPKIHELCAMSMPLFVCLFSKEVWCIHVTN